MKANSKQKEQDFMLAMNSLNALAYSVLDRRIRENILHTQDFLMQWYEKYIKGGKKDA